MVNASIEELAIRMDMLERENLWLKRSGGVAVGVVMLALAFGTSWGGVPKQITTGKLVLTDSRGNPRARLEVRVDGAPTLALLSPRGEDQVLLRAGNDGTSSLDYMESRLLRASLTNLAGTGAHLSLHNSNNRSIAKMFMNREGASGLTLGRDRRSIGMNVDSDGTAQLTFADRQGHSHEGMRLEPNGVLSVLGRAETLPLAEPPATTQFNILEDQPILTRGSRPVRGDRAYNAP